MKTNEPTAAEGFERYRRWQQREDAKDLRELRDWQEHAIAKEDPEADKLVRALEIGWIDPADMELER